MEHTETTERTRRWLFRHCVDIYIYTMEHTERTRRWLFRHCVDITMEHTETEKIKTLTVQALCSQHINHGTYWDYWKNKTLTVQALCTHKYHGTYWKNKTLTVQAQCTHIYAMEHTERKRRWLFRHCVHIYIPWNILKEQDVDCSGTVYTYTMEHYYWKEQGVDCSNTV